MLDKILNLKNGNNSVNEFCDYIRRGIPSAAFGVTGAFKSFLASAIDGNVLLVAKDSVTANAHLTEIRELSGKTVVCLPPRDETLARGKAFSKDGTYTRLNALDKIKSADIVIITPETLIEKCCKEVKSVNVKSGCDYDIYQIINSIVALGYKRADSAESKGTFAVRGDIIDIFAINYDEPIRAEFFGDTIESLKKIDPESRKSLGVIKEAKILQAQEFLFNVEDYPIFKEAVKKELSKVGKEGYTRMRTVADDMFLAMETRDNDSMLPLAPLSDTGSIFDYLPQNTVIVFDEAKRIHELIFLTRKEFCDRYESLLKGGEIFSFATGNICSEEELADRLKSFRLAAMQTLSTAVPFFNPLKIVNPSSSGIVNYRLDFNEFFTDLRNWLKGGYRILVCTGENKRSIKLSYELSGKEIPSVVGGDELSGVVVTDCALTEGFIFHEEKVVLIGSGNLYRKPPEKITKKSKKATFFTAPETGDYCVHEVHGIGKVLGNKRISTTEGTKDYIAVEYGGGDVLYIPVEQLDVLTRYLGGEKTPKLSKIGGGDFEKIKNAVKESIKKMSFDLKKLYAERKSKKGFPFVTDKELEREFDADFPFEETPDQISADAAIKEDMSGDGVMDRLVCGDVGFGKTEVAFRAVFRAVANGKQAVLLAPTTILTEQHFTTAKERFSRFGVKIACLNRFRTAKEAKKIIEGLKEGDIDFVIGTHRLLGKDVGFKDLGLLVLDEEQRFGVEHKEKIKLLKNNVDTLTLTATPIPRTLHMSLSGIRPISTINTPPKKRLPVQTYVTEETDALIKDAVYKEINRGGQVFILYNRVESIEVFAKKVSSLMPDVKLTFAHGRMEEKILEKRIMSFYRGEYDLLISTTIIENGIDLPRANTLIVIDADRLGLSTLYQLKGRVGRSDRLAYAYFTFKRDKILSSNAFDRLNAIIEFTEMGSGIKVAMRDLEIRGAGNILGAEQHGHMDKVGYELYSKLLKEEFEGTEEVIPELDVRLTAYIPESYIESNSARMSAYKEIAEITTDSDVKETIGYLNDAYGAIPTETMNLISISVVKRLAMKIKATKIVISKERSVIAFSDFKVFGDEKLRSAIDEFSDGVRISMAAEPAVEFLRNGESSEEMLARMREFLVFATK